MVVCACEPRGLDLNKYPEYYRAFCCWLYRAHSELFTSRKPESGPRGYHRYGELLQMVFPQHTVPDSRMVEKWATGEIDWVQKVCELGCPHPGDLYRQWQSCHPEEVKELRKLLGMPNGLKAQEYLGEQLRVVPVYSAQPQFYASGNNVVSQTCAAMYQVLILAMVGWFAGQCAEIATSYVVAPPGFPDSQKRKLA